MLPLHQSPWRPHHRHFAVGARCEHLFVFTIQGSDYVYLLGLYLGDGSMSSANNQLKVTLGAEYPGIILACAEAMERISPNRVSVRKQNIGECFQVYSAWYRWPLLFPQHDPGRKHTRPIVLTTWQWELVRHHREQFVRGLIHSDGCRTVNRFKTKLPSGRVAEYEYVRYFFSNMSADIRLLFRQVCDELGIRTTQSNHRNVSVAHRDSVAILERIVGPKL
jgi:hypothetical protein